MRSALVIDDNPAVVSALEMLFGLHDIRVVSAGNPQDGLVLLEKSAPDLVIADMNFSADTTSGAEGVALFYAMRELYPDLPIILLTAWTSVESAVRLVKAGASDYVAKPWDDAKLLATVENLLELGEATRERDARRRERKRRRQDLASRFDLCGAVFESEVMARTIELSGRVASSGVPILITGPNGAGKEKIAHIVHANSKLAGRLVAVNCGAIPGDLVEAELFGAEAGAYTSANRARDGRFDVADGGTLFLDEIAHLPLASQVKLLRVLETGEFERLGSSRTRTAKVRIISATNSDLRKLVIEEHFREDLFYRLNVVEIEVPALAERPDDIIPIAEHFLAGNGHLADEARVALLAHSWPGNVRELRNVMDRAKLLSTDGVIRTADLNLPAPSALKYAPEDLDRETIEAAIRSADGVVSRAAQQLGLSRQALYRRMERLNRKT